MHSQAGGDVSFSAVFNLIKNVFMISFVFNLLMK